MNFDDPEGFRAMLEARGLSVPLAHVPLDLLKVIFRAPWKSRTRLDSAA